MPSTPLLNGAARGSRNARFSCAGDGTSGPDLCDAVLSALKKHPALGEKVAEVFASLAREGECVQCFIKKFLQKGA